VSQVSTNLYAKIFYFEEHRFRLILLCLPSPSPGNDFGAFSSLMGLPGGNLPQQNLMTLNNSFGGGAFAGLPQAGGNSMMAALAAQQQMFSQAKVG
jgi:hypothetical protein